MKVLHVIPSLSYAHGGPSHAMRLTEQALRNQGIEVETATTDDDGPGARNNKRCGVPLKERGVIRHYFPKRLEFYKVSPGFARWINEHVRDYDVVHIHALFSFTSVVAARAARRAGVPYVVRPLGTLNRYGVTQRRPWLKQLSLKFIEGPILRNADAVHFTAEAEKLEADALGIPMRAVMIPLGIDEVEAIDGNVFLESYPALRGARIVLYLSRLDPKKNVEGLLEAFSLLDKADPSNPPSTMSRSIWESKAHQAEPSDLMLVIAGEGSPAYVASLHRLARKLGLTDRVFWVGQIAGDMKAGAYAAARVFVLPSFSENFGIAAAEALMAGLPCVLGKGVAIADEVAQAGAGLAVSPEPKQIAKALQQVLDDEKLRAEMSERAAVLARESYSLEAMGKGLHELYSKIHLQKQPGQSE